MTATVPSAKTRNPLPDRYNALVLSTTDIAMDAVSIIRGLLEKYPTFGREKETGLLGALGT